MVLASVLALCGCAAPQAPGPWFQGVFVGTLGDGAVRHEYAVQCSAARACQLRIEVTDGTAAPTIHAAATASAPPVRARIPNHNLDFVRRAVARDPGLFDDPAEGPLLAPIRDLLSSGETLTECFDLSTEASGSLVLCNRSGDVSARRTVLLLVNTMKATCSRGAFCAYHVVPLARRPA